MLPWWLAFRRFQTRHIHKLIRRGFGHLRQLPNCRLDVVPLGEREGRFMCQGVQRWKEKLGLVAVRCCRNVFEGVYALPICTCPPELSTNFLSGTLERNPGSQT